MREVETADRRSSSSCAWTPDDMGKVIGKQGRIAKAIRAVVKAASLKTGQNVLVEIV